MSSEPRMASLQQDRSRRAKRVLSESAYALFVDQGFDRTSVSEICERAGIPRGNFYFYFQRKEELLFEFGRGAVEAVAAAVDQSIGRRDSVRTTLRTLVSVYARETEKLPKPLLDRVILEMTAGWHEWRRGLGDQLGYNEIIRRVVLQAREDGILAVGVGVSELTQMLVAVLREGSLAWARDLVGDRALEVLLWRRFQIVLNGAAVPLEG